MKYVAQFFIAIWSFIFKRDFNMLDAFFIATVIKQDWNWSSWQFWTIWAVTMLVSVAGSEVYERLRRYE